MSTEELESIRAHLQQGRVLTGTKFQHMVEKALGRPISLEYRGRPHRNSDEERVT